MSRVITDQAAFLIEARDTLKEVEGLKQLSEKLEIEEKRLEKALASEKKAVADAIAVTIKKRKEEIAASYDKEIGKDQEKLKKIRGKREKAKNQGIKERIEEETAELREQNEELKTQTKTLFRQNRVPGFCNSLFYYAIYFPRGLMEILIFVLTIAVCFFAIPIGIYALLPVQKLLYGVLIFVITVLVSVGLYVMIGNYTKVPHMESLRKGRAARNLIIINNKKIKKIIHNVKKDKNEDFYDLENFDDEIAQLDGQIAAIGRRKQEALTNFENVTKNIISDEIMGNSQERLDQLETQFAQTTEELKETEALIKARNIFITDNYEIYVGKEFLQMDRMNRLIEIISNEEAENITEAIQVYKNGKN